MFQKETQRIIKSISLDLAIPEKYIEEVIASQFKFTRDAITSATKNEINTFKTIKLYKLAKVVPSKERLYYLNKVKQKKDEDQSKQNLQGGEEQCSINHSKESN